MTGRRRALFDLERTEGCSNGSSLCVAPEGRMETIEARFVALGLDDEAIHAVRIMNRVM